MSFMFYNIELHVGLYKIFGTKGRSDISGVHMRAPPPLGQAEDGELHSRMDGNPPSAG